MSSKRGAEALPPGEPGAERTLKRVVHPTDLSAESELAFAHALRLALSARGALSVLHVSGTGKGVAWADFPGVRQTLVRWGVLPDGGSRVSLEKIGLAVEKVKLRGRDPARALLRYLERQPRDVIVLATHRRRGFDRWLQDEVARPLAYGAGLLTLFVPDGVRGFVSPKDGRDSLSHVVIPVDRDPDGQIAVTAAGSLARVLGASSMTFKLLHVGTRAGMPRLELPRRSGFRWVMEVRKGDVVEQVLASAARSRAGLIALATRGRNGILDALRGSTTERILAETPCPVLAVPVR